MRATGPLLSRPLKSVHIFTEPFKTPLLSAICLPCQLRISRFQTRQNVEFNRVRQRIQGNRTFHTTLKRHDTQPKLPHASSNNTPAVDSTKSPSDPVVHPVADEELPSHHANKRWDLSKRFHAMMDDLMKNIALASHRINTYTGTDYSGIEALRSEIKEQEQLVKARHQSLTTAKAELDGSHHKQTTSSTELVALLERKHSWASSDLEKYMSLVRSEHANDQAVQKAKDRVAEAEKTLEEARTRLEKRERAQYHEEQIWSDTIRRNSTWVTISLMGVNIGLLLVNLIVFEPWRRRRLVKEVRTALDEKTIHPYTGLIEEPAELTKAPEAPQEAIAAETINIQTQDEEFPTEQVSAPPAEELKPELFQTWSLNWAKLYLQGLVSHQPILIRKVDITTVAVQAAATGAALTGLVVFLIRPH